VCLRYHRHHARIHGSLSKVSLNFRDENFQGCIMSFIKLSRYGWPSSACKITRKFPVFFFQPGRTGAKHGFYALKINGFPCAAQDIYYNLKTRLSAMKYVIFRPDFSALNIPAACNGIILAQFPGRTFPTTDTLRKRAFCGNALSRWRLSGHGSCCKFRRRAEVPVRNTP
jgi:hypothetical protein